jgi:hypothetical protein
MFSSIYPGWCRFLAESDTTSPSGWSFETGHPRRRIAEAPNRRALQRWPAVAAAAEIAGLQASVDVQWLAVGANVEITK